MPACGPRRARVKGFDDEMSENTWVLFVGQYDRLRRWMDEQQREGREFRKGEVIHAGHGWGLRGYRGKVEIVHGHGPNYSLNRAERDDVRYACMMNDIHEGAKG